MFLDESGAHLAMGRSHAWLRRGTELIEPRPMNWGTNLTMVGAMRIDGWLTLATGGKAMDGPRFLAWVRRRLVPRLRRGDIVADNLGAHKTRAVRDAMNAQIPSTTMADMRGDDRQPTAMFSYVSAEDRVPADHPLRPIRALVDEIWQYERKAQNRC